MWTVRDVAPELTAIHLETRFSRMMGFGAWVYLRGDVLVDSAFPHVEEELVAALTGRVPRLVVHTHVHEDHIGGSAAVAERYGVSVRAPSAGLAVLADPTRLRERFYEHTMWGQPRGVAAEALGAEVRTADVRLEVIPTPGHAPEHVVFFDRERGWVFAGDLYLGSRIRMARPFENATDVLDSLRRVRALDPELLFCTHRGVVKSPAAALDAKIDFLGGVRHRVRVLRERGWSLRRIGREVLGKEHLGYWLYTGGDYTVRNLVRACLKEPGEGYLLPGSVRYRL